ncbi:MAG: site-specific DNA-methyltransferase [Candidatus Micrarchaeaceae archaeon]
MKEVPDSSIHLIVTSPPYFNAPFDYPDMFKDYDDFLNMITDVSKEMFRVLARGRVVCLVTQDVRIDGKLYPITSDILRIMMSSGFTYRDRIIWRKPDGYVRISRRSGVLIQHPYPMYYYPDNVFEEILIVQKGRYKRERSDTQIDIERFNREKWYLNVWDITNVLPSRNDGVAAFPEEIPYRLITLFSHVGETVLDPFAGSGTTLKVAKELGRKAIGYEIDTRLMDVIRKKVNVEMIIRDDAKKVS